MRVSVGRALDRNIVAARAWDIVVEVVPSAVVFEGVIVDASPIVAKIAPGTNIARERGIHCSWNRHVVRGWHRGGRRKDAVKPRWRGKVKPRGDGIFASVRGRGW